MKRKMECVHYLQCYLNYRFIYITVIELMTMKSFDDITIQDLSDRANVRRSSSRFLEFLIEENKKT
ncbi:hypothetical protein GJB61_12110 [Paenibacillus sp. LC-T2]|uniref:Uncharacterized protein n=1 Tax=Paenibacillus monticola TaxID=2666075 RepID=A0A7X2L207_9BACL|nr:hypothetical protein [Paenibacillus monticola]